MKFGQVWPNFQYFGPFVPFWAIGAAFGCPGTIFFNARPNGIAEESFHKSCFPLENSA